MHGGKTRVLAHVTNVHREEIGTNLITPPRPAIAMQYHPHDIWETLIGG